MLHLPLPNHPLSVFTGTSNVGIGELFAQRTPEGEHPIFFLSQKLIPSEQRYTVIEKEALAMRWAIASLVLPLGTAI